MAPLPEVGPDVTDGDCLRGFIGVHVAIAIEGESEREFEHTGIVELGFPANYKRRTEIGVKNS